MATLVWLDAVLGASPDPVFAADRAGQLTYLNAAARERWGAELGGPARAIVGDALARPAADALASGVATRFQWGEHGPGGVRAWFAATVVPLGADGYWCSCTDITELKREEQRLRRSEQLMVDTQGTAHLGTWEWDITQPTAVWSDELYRIYGLTPETYTPSYEAYLTIVHPDDRQRVIDATNRVFHEHIPYSHDERIFRPDGTMRHLHTWAHPVLDDQGKLVRLVGVCQDVTDRALAEDAVRELAASLERRVAERTQQIERSLHDLEQFNSMVSHDLRAPLAVIQICTDLLTRESLPEHLRDKVTRIQKSVEHMNALVEDLLGLARVGHGELRAELLDVSAVAREIVDELRTRDPERDATVRIADGITCTGDPGLMRVVLTNLLSNAWKFTSAHARAEIAVEHQDGTLVIRDNGVGFDMKDAAKLFAAFQRLHRAEDFPGTGVGLATVHRIVERHGGRIWAEAAPGAGATFFIALPTLR